MKLMMLTLVVLTTTFLGSARSFAQGYTDIRSAYPNQFACQDRDYWDPMHNTIRHPTGHIVDSQVIIWDADGKGGHSGDYELHNEGAKCAELMDEIKKHVDSSGKVYYDAENLGQSYDVEAFMKNVLDASMYMKYKNQD